MAEGGIYRNDQKDAQKLWLEKNPGYWKDYREKNSQYAERNRQKQRERNRSSRAQTDREPSSGPIAKMDASIAKMDAIGPESPTFSGIYKLVPLAGSEIAKMDALIVEITAISSP